MRLKSDDLIAGVPARQLRDLLSFYHTGLRVEGVAHRLKIEQAALPMPALRRPHDWNRGLRARLRAKVAADHKQDRHIMSQTASHKMRLTTSA